MEMGSKIAIEFVRGGCNEHHHCLGLVNMARDLVRRNWQMKVTHTCREGNLVADWLTGYSTVR